MSDFFFIKTKAKISKKNLYNHLSNLKTPYVKNISDPVVILLCFIKAYASHTYTHRGSFKEYLKDVFNVFYNL